MDDVGRIVSAVDIVERVLTRPSHAHNGKQKDQADFAKAANYLVKQTLVDLNRCATALEKIAAAADLYVNNNTSRYP